MAIDIIARLKIKASEFTQGVSAETAKLEQALEQSGTRAGAGFSRTMGLTLAAGAAAAVGIVAEAIRSSIELGREISSSARDIGVGVEALQEYRNAALGVGLAAGDADSALTATTRRINQAAAGNRDAAESFAALGIRFRDTAGAVRQTDDVFRDVVATLNAIEDPAQRAEAGTALLGDEYRRIEPLVRAGTIGIDQMTESLRAQNGVLTQEQIDTLAAANVEYERLNNILSINIASIVADNADSIRGLTDWLANFSSTATRAGTAWLGFVRNVSRFLSPMETARDAVFSLFSGDGRTGRKQSSDRIGASPFSRFNNILSGPAVNAAYDLPSAATGGVGGRRGGGAARTAGASSGDREAEAAARRFLEVERRLTESYAEQLQIQSDAQRIEAIRVEQGEDAAALARLQAEFLRRHPEAAAQTVEEFARLAELQPPVTAADRERLQVLMDQLGVIQRQNDESEKQRQEHAALAAIAGKDQAGEAQQARKREQALADERRQGEDNLRDLSDLYEDLFTGNINNIWRNFKRAGIQAIAAVAAQMTLGQLSGVGGGASAGLVGGSGGIFGNLLGGTLGGVAGGATKLLKNIGLPPGLASGIGPMALVGAGLSAISLLSGLVSGTKKGSATLGFSGGALGVGATGGNSSSRIAAASSSIGGLASTLEGIAQQLGGTITGAGSVSIGVRKKNYVVDTTGAGRTKGAGVLKFKTEEDAIRAALADALKDGVIGAISDASRRILAAGGNLEKAIEKAALIESIPRLLKARLDPLGAALDELNSRWDKMIAALREGGASVEQMAEAQQLYRLELEDTRQQAGVAGQALRAFLDSLNFGSSSPLSLRDQLTFAQEALQPFLDKIDTGASFDQSAYQAAAQSFLDIQRQINASGPEFFAAFDRIRDYTRRGIANVENVTPLSPPRDPFIERTAQATQSTAEILAQQTAQLASIDSYLAQIAAQGAASGGFVGSLRGFA